MANGNYVIAGLCVFIVLPLFLLVFVVHPMREVEIEKSRLNKARIEARIQERIETERRVHKEAVENGVAEYYLDAENVKQFRWLKADGDK